MGDRASRAPGAELMRRWESLRRLPLGKGMFGLLLGWMVPYSGSIGAHVLELAPGHARLALRDRRALRNHLGSIHAVALTNLGELASGLAMTTALPPGRRAIVTALTTAYSKKARGTITATSDVALPALGGEVELDVTAELRDTGDAVVARTTARWRIGPV